MPMMAPSIATLADQYPCRNQQIETLASHLALASTSGAPILVHGPQSTGKTSVVRDLLTVLEIKHVYVNYNQASRTKTVTSTIYNQMRGNKRTHTTGYDYHAKCDTIPEFLRKIPSLAPSNKPPVWLVLDNAQRMAGTELLTALMRLKDTTGANVGLILISSVPWASGVFSRDTHSTMPPLSIAFPAYNAKELQQIVLLRKERWLGKPPAAHSDYFISFLNSFVAPFSRASNNILDLQAAIDFLWPKYIQPVKDGKKAKPDQLYARIKQDHQRIISNLDLSSAPLILNKNSENPSTAQFLDKNATERPNDARASNKGLSLELPFLSKHLLLAAYIASRNKPTSDRAVFDPSYIKKGKKDAGASDKRAEAAMEAALKGPHSFPLERLLHIFYCLYSATGGTEGDDVEEKVVGGSKRQRLGDDDGAKNKQTVSANTKSNNMIDRTSGAFVEAQHAEVMMQLSTLVSLRLLSQGGGDLLEGSNYRCNLSDEVANNVANNLRLRLQDYLRMG